MTTERLGKKKSFNNEKASKPFNKGIKKVVSKEVVNKDSSSHDQTSSGNDKASSSNDKILPIEKKEKAPVKEKATKASTTKAQKHDKPFHQEKSSIEKIKERKIKSNHNDDQVVPTTTSTKKKSKSANKAKKTTTTTTVEVYCHPNDVIHGKSRVRYEAYVDPKQCQEKIEQGKYFKGLLRINKRNRTDAYVTCENLDADIFINGQRDRNRALDGDTVIVELLDLETVWAKKKESMIQKREQRHSTAAERPPQEEGEDDKAKPKYVGKVVSIFAPNNNNLCSGTLSIQQRFADSHEPVDLKNVRLAWFKPVDPRNPLIAIQLKNAPADLLKDEEKYKHLLLVAKVTRWPIDSSTPFGTIVRELGPIGNIVAETQAVLADNNIAEKPFGQKALNALPEIPWSIKQADINKRRDLRETRIFTIDPATAKDLDDAVHITKLDNDEFEVGVHIADVSHFVNQHTALDHEAYDRGTSTYLCDRVIPMLPSLLCEELCSLNPGVER